MYQPKKTPKKTTHPPYANWCTKDQDETLSAWQNIGRDPYGVPPADEKQYNPRTEGDQVAPQYTWH